MSANAPNLFVSQFSTNLDLLLQQKGSKLRGRVMTGTHVGKQASPVDQIGAVEATVPAGRFAPIGRTDALLTRRWVFPQDREIPQMFDRFDQLRMISDPKSRYAENAAYGIGRAWDDAIITAALATSQIGETGTGTETFPAGDIIAEDFGSSVDAGLTAAKIIEAKRIFESHNVDLDADPMTIVISPLMHSNLLNQAVVTSTDFNKPGARPVLTEGKVTSFLGADIIVSNRLQLTDTDDRQAIAFVKSGMYLGIWEDIFNDVSQRKDLSGLPWQLYTCATFGATRLQAGKVVSILCEE
jgi:hypothetical protein